MVTNVVASCSPAQRTLNTRYRSLGPVESGNHDIPSLSRSTCAYPFPKVEQLTMDAQLGSSHDSAWSQNSYVEESNHFHGWPSVVNERPRQFDEDLQYKEEASLSDIELQKDDVSETGSYAHSTASYVHQKPRQNRASHGRGSDKGENFVKRPLNSFMLYRKDNQHKFTDTNNHQSISCVIGEMWRKETAEVKNHYDELSKIAKQKHAEEHPGYKFQPRKKINKTRNVTRTPRRKVSDDQQEPVEQSSPILSRSLSQASFHTASSYASVPFFSSPETYQPMINTYIDQSRLDPQDWHSYMSQPMYDYNTQDHSITTAELDQYGGAYDHYNPTYVPPLDFDYIATSEFAPCNLTGTWEIQHRHS